MNENDLKYHTLRSMGFSGDLNKMLWEYYGTTGVSTVAKTLNQREYEFLGIQGFTSLKGLNDRWYAYLYSKGYRGSINDMTRQALLAGNYFATTPVPPGPLDRLVPTVNGLDAFTTPFSATYGNLIVRVFYRNNAASTPTIAATWNGVPMTQIGHFVQPVIGAGGVIAFGIRAGATGTRDLALTVTGGSAGVAAVRIGELVSMDVTWQGDVDGNSLTTPQYYQEVTMNDTGPGDTASIVGWCTDQAAAISPSYSDVSQWNTEQNNGTQSMAARFGRGTSPSGESGSDLYVFYAASGANLPNSAAMVFEIRGAVVP